MGVDHLVANKLSLVVEPESTKSESSKAAELDQIFSKSEERRKREAAAWRPSEVLERTALQVIGCWQMVVAEVNFTYFHSVGRGGPPPDTNKLPATIHGVAQNYRIRWPHDDWSLSADQVGKVRHKLAHLLYIDSITGERPHRIMNFVRLGAPGAPRKTPEGHPGELSWRDDTWSQQTMHLDTLTEDELRDSLYRLQWMRDCCHILGRLGYILNEFAPRMEYLPDHEKAVLPWWFPEWGDKATTRLRVADLRGGL